MKEVYQLPTTVYRIFVLFSLFILYSLFYTPVYAVCPVCTVAVGAGLGLARFLGVDDSVSGIWIGGLILSSSFWFSGWLKKKFSFPQLITSHLSPIAIAAMFAVTLIPLWISGVIGHPFNTLWGLDKLLVGVVLGSLAFTLGMIIDKQIRKEAGHQLFIYQKVFFPVMAIAISSILMYLISR